MDVLKDFGVQLPLLVAQMINFLIMLFVLNKLLYKPILKMLEVRKQRIAEAMKNASDLESRLAKLEEEQAKTMAKTQAEADTLLAETKDNAKKLSDQVISQAREQAEKMAQKAHEQAKAEQEKLRSELRSEVVTIAVTAAQKVVDEVLTKEQRVQLTQKAAKEIAAS